MEEIPTPERRGDDMVRPAEGDLSPAVESQNSETRQAAPEPSPDIIGKAPVNPEVEKPFDYESELLKIETKEKDIMTV